jgi:hypothetical protein
MGKFPSIPGYLRALNPLETIRNRFWRGGMGLHSSQLEFLREAISRGQLRSFVEFGSGGSTEFLGHELLKVGGSLTSFDHSLEHCWKGSLSSVQLHIRPLIEFSEIDFNQAFSLGSPPPLQAGFPPSDPMSFEARRTFYSLDEKDLPKRIDLLLVDGPSGDGRSIAFLHALPRMSAGALVVIDDVHHYDFEDRLHSIAKVTKVAGEINPRVHPNFGWGAYRVEG